MHSECGFKRTTSHHAGSIPVKELEKDLLVPVPLILYKTPINGFGILLVAKEKIPSAGMLLDKVLMNLQSVLTINILLRTLGSQVEDPAFISLLRVPVNGAYNKKMDERDILNQEETGLLNRS
jgi:hypothetical protein